MRGRKIVFFFVCAMIHSVLLGSSLKSTTGTLLFDSNNDSTPEMALDVTGLAIGSTTATANLDITGNGIISNELIIGETTNTSGSNLHYEIT